MRNLLSIVLITLVAGVAVPSTAEAQSIPKKIRSAAKERLKTRSEKTEEHILEQTRGAVDSTIAPGAEGIDSAVSVVGGAAAGLPRVLGTAVGGGGEGLRIRKALESGRAVLPGIAFLPGTVQFAKTAEPHLAALAEAMVAVGGTFLIECWVDPGGDAEFTQELSAGRAGTIKARLVREGIAGADLFAVGRGSAAPGSGQIAAARVEVARMR
jgi:outer membrane protein OmpA-like peptidoglycan-associated protein